MQIFPYIHDFFDHLDNNTANDSQGEYASCCHVLIEFIQDLASVNMHNTRLLMVMYLHECVDLMMEKTKKQQKLQFELLDAMVRGVKNQTITASASAVSVSVSVSVSATKGSDDVPAAVLSPAAATEGDKKHLAESNGGNNFAEESKGEPNLSPGGSTEELLLPTT